MMVRNSIANHHYRCLCYAATVAAAAAACEGYSSNVMTIFQEPKGEAFLSHMPRLGHTRTGVESSSYGRPVKRGNNVLVVARVLYVCMRCANANWQDILACVCACHSLNKLMHVSKPINNNFLPKPKTSCYGIDPVAMIHMLPCMYVSIHRYFVARVRSCPPTPIQYPLS